MSIDELISALNNLAANGREIIQALCEPDNVRLFIDESDQLRQLDPALSVLVNIGTTVETRVSEIRAVSRSRDRLMDPGLIVEVN